MRDIEEQKGYHLLASDEKLQRLPRSSVIYEQTVSTKKKLLALLGYFVCNVGLTVYNKAVLGKVMYPICHESESVADT